MKNKRRFRPTIHLSLSTVSIEFIEDLNHDWGMNNFSRTVDRIVQDYKNFPKVTKAHQEENRRLRDEIASLKTVLDMHGIDYSKVKVSSE